MAPAKGRAADVKELVGAIGALTQAIGAQTQAIGSMAQAIGASHVDHESRLRKLEEIATVLKERLTLWQLGQAAYTTIAGALVALFTWFKSLK